MLLAALFSEIFDPRFGDQTGAASARMLYALSLFRKNSLEIHGKSALYTFFVALKYIVD